MPTWLWMSASSPVLKRHFSFPAVGVQRVEVAVPAADKQRAVGDRRRGVNDVAGLELPGQLAGRGVQRIDVAIAAAEVNFAIPHCGRRKIEVERVGHALGRGLRAVEMCAGVTALAGGLKLPFQLAGLGVAGVEESVEACRSKPCRHQPRARSVTRLPVLAFHFSVPVC